MSVFNIIGETCEITYLIAVIVVTPPYLTHIFRPQVASQRWFKVCGKIWQTLWPLGLPAIISQLLDNQADGDYVGMLLNGFSLWGWWLLRNWPDDNHWKRRAKKLGSKVKSLGHRLVIAPAGAL